MTEKHRLEEYHSKEGATEYFEEYEKLHRRWSDRRERRILDRFFARMGPVQNALDLPCGWGRYLPYLKHHGLEVIQSDYSGSMLQMSRQRFAEMPVTGRTRGSGTEIPLKDQCVDLAFSIRLNHHLVDPVSRRKHLAELMRVSKRFVIVTYFDAGSIKNRLRIIKVKFQGKKPKNTLRQVEVRRDFTDNGFRILEAPLLFAIGSGHRVVLAERERSIKRGENVS